MNAVLYTHTCTDGFGCSLVFTKVLELEYPNIIYASYTDIDDKISRLVTSMGKDLVVIADMYPSPELVDKLDVWSRETKTRVLLYDHHKSAIRFGLQYAWAHINTEISTAMLMMKRFHHDMMRFWEPDRRLIETIIKVDAWDMWRLSDRYRAGGEAIARYVDLVGPQQAVIDYMTDNTLMFDEDLALLLGRVETKEVGRAVSGIRSFSVVVDGKEFDIGVMYAERARFGFGIMSDTAFELFPQLDYILIVHVLDGAVTIRSIEHDALAVALLSGGGGDTRSAGFNLNRPVTISAQWEEELVSSLFAGSTVRYNGIPD